VLNLFFDDFASETSTNTKNGDGNKDQIKDMDETFKYIKKNKHHPYCPETVSKKFLLYILMIRTNGLL
jgi:hypothetical protein